MGCVLGKGSPADAEDPEEDEHRQQEEQPEQGSATSTVGAPADTRPPKARSTAQLSEMADADARSLVLNGDEAEARPETSGAPSDTHEAPAGGIDSSHVKLQRILHTQIASDSKGRLRTTTAAGLKHIGFGPMKKENQDEYFSQIGSFGGTDSGNCFCIFDGHGNHGAAVSRFCVEQLPAMLDQKLTEHRQKLGPGMLTVPAITTLVKQSFVETETKLKQLERVNISNSGTTASVVYQDGSQVWVAAAGDSRVVIMQWIDDKWKAQPLTLDHRPSRGSEMARVVAAGGRVEPKRLPNGSAVGEQRLWLQDMASPGLMLSRSIGDGMASSVGCSAEPEVTLLTLQPHVDRFIVIASDGVWDVQSNEQVCQLVVEAVTPEAACQKILDTCLCEWEEKLSADNISVVVAMFDWEE